MKRSGTEPFMEAPINMSSKTGCPYRRKISLKPNRALSCSRFSIFIVTFLQSMEELSHVRNRVLVPLVDCHPSFVDRLCAGQRGRGSSRYLAVGCGAFFAAEDVSGVRVRLPRAFQTGLVLVENGSTYPAIHD